MTEVLGMNKSNYIYTEKLLGLFWIQLHHALRIYETRQIYQVISLFTQVLFRNNYLLILYLSFSLYFHSVFLLEKHDRGELEWPCRGMFCF